MIQTWKSRAANPFAALLAFAGVLALLLSACGSGSTQNSSNALPDSQQIFHDTVNPGSNDIATMDPAVSQDLYSSGPISLVFPSLLTLDDSLTIQPWAASGWSVSSDGLTYTFHMRSGMQFSDGEPIDANTFTYSINRTLDPCTASPVAQFLYPVKNGATFNGETCANGTRGPGKGQTGPVINTLIGSSLTAPDAQTFVVTLGQPAPYFLMEIASATHADGVPQKLVTQYGAKWTDHLADGSGFGGNLFKLTKWNHSGVLVLQRNDSFWGTKPKLREIDYTIFKAADPEYNAYLAGQNDRTDVPSAQYTNAKGKSDFHEIGSLSLNFYQPNWKTPPFDDMRMRQAFELALDKQAIVTDVLHGSAIPSNHLIPTGMMGSNSSLMGPDGATSVAGNPAKAKQLATAYAAEKCNGQFSQCPPVTLTIPTGDQSIQNEAEVAQQEWQSAMPGYPIKVNTLDFNTLVSQLSTHTLQLFGVGWVGSPDAQDWISVWFSPSASYNFGSVNVPDASALMQKADTESDEAQRSRDYASAEQLLVTQVAWITLNQPKAFYLVRSYVQNYRISPNMLPTLGDYQHMYIAKH